MNRIKRRYTLAEAAEYLRRATGTQEISIYDIVAFAAEGELLVCFPYKGPLGLFKNDHPALATNAESAHSIFRRALETSYFNGILRSLARPSPDNELTDLRGKAVKAHTLRPVRVMPISDFGSAPPGELAEPEGHHWRRVYGSGSSWAGTQLLSDVPEAEWMIEAENLHALAVPLQPPGAQRSPDNKPQQESPEQRRNRRLARLHELGGHMENAGTGWHLQGLRGALALLISEEKAARRPMSDKTDIRRDLSTAAERMRDGGAISSNTGGSSPEHSRSALEEAWGNRRGS